MSLSIAKLPTITFVTPGAEKELVLSACGERLGFLSDWLKETIPAAQNVGILLRSSEELVLYWLAALDAGKTPLILQYPTQKLSRSYWTATLDSTIATLKLDAVICDAALGEAVAGRVTTIVHEPARTQTAGRNCVEIAPRDVLQMSSGTTGMRKGIDFSWDRLGKHVALYNQVVNLSSQDRIVSWLPLYHDMGFIAAFAMPLILGVPVVMMDPIDWVQERGLLFEAIRTHRATVCYMPNFGFEVMSRLPCDPAALASMRLWISCSEPTYRSTIERFCTATQTSADRVAVCYAMAENIFAVTQRSGLRTSLKDEIEVVSCGTPLPETNLKLIDDQIWVRSPTSIARYVSGESIVDQDGFYPTGDMGFVEGGELFITGRRHDLLIQGGRKFFLNDFDQTLNMVDPSCKGRGASLAVRDTRLGTEKLVILVEREDFYDVERKAELHRSLAAALPIEDFELHFVPPTFITKTSSGKVNRKQTAEDFERIRGWNIGDKSTSFEDEIYGAFPYSNAQLPIGEAVDSLGLLMAQMLAEEHGIKFDRTMSIADLVKGQPKPADAASGKRQAISLISCMDASSPGFSLSTEDLQQLSQDLGITVNWEHVCVPPVHFLWQDVVFRDYFLPRQPSEKYNNFLRALGKLDHASVLLFDDTVELGLGECAFPVMDWKFRRAPIADLVAYRFQRYALQHHQLPVGDIALGMSVSPAQRESAFRAISSYFKAPIFRSAFHQLFAASTAGWEHVDLESKTSSERHARFVAALRDFLKEQLSGIRLREMDDDRALRISDDQAHFCSFVVNPHLIEMVVARFDTFLIQGMPNSLPYLTRRITELGKRFIYIPTLNPDGTIGLVDADIENACVIQAGAWRECVTNLPVIRLMHGNDADMKNLPEDLPIPEVMIGNSNLKLANRFRYIQELKNMENLRNTPPEKYPDFVKL